MRRKSESGATLIEAAIALPILILIIVAILELGLIFKDYLTVSYLSREGARIGALAGNDPEADCAILRGLGQLATPNDLERITQIQIFKADNGSGTQGVTNTAVYKGAPADPTACSVPSVPSDGWTLNSSPWPPTSRQTSVGSTNLDIIGVRILQDHPWITGMPPFSGTKTVDESTITRMEPEVFE